MVLTKGEAASVFSRGRGGGLVRWPLQRARCAGAAWLLGAGSGGRGKAAQSGRWLCWSPCSWEHGCTWPQKGQVHFQHRGVKSQGRSLLHSLWNLEEAFCSRCFPGGAVVKKKKKSLPANAGRLKKCGLDSWVGKIPWRRKWQPTPVFLPGGSHGQRSLAVYSPCDCTESDSTEHARRPRQRQTLHQQEVHLMIPFLPLAQALLE